MKKLGILSVAFLLVLSLSSSATAASYRFSSTNDNWGGDSVWGKFPIPNYPGIYDYQRDVTDREFSWIQFDDSGWQLGDGMDSSYKLLADMSWFGNDSQWQKRRPWWRKRPPRFDCPRPGSPAPVPEPSTMILLGMGLAGIAVPGRKKIFKKK